MKYYIVPKNQEIVIDGEDKEDAICNFAVAMDSDMNTYFTVLTEDEYEDYKCKHSDAAAHERHVTKWMKEKLIEDFDMPVDEADGYAIYAYEIYCRGDGQTEYECVEEAFADWENEH